MIVNYELFPVLSNATSVFIRPAITDTHRVESRVWTNSAFPYPANFVLFKSGCPNGKGTVALLTHVEKK